jgi:hypothetical protein
MKIAAETPKAPIRRKRAYLETSALDAILKRAIPVSHVRSQLEARGLTACVGTLTLNECAQPILSDQGEIAQELFRIMRDLQPRFLTDSSALHEQEARLFRCGTPVNPHPDSAQEEYERTEVDQLADGRVNLRLLELVQQRRVTKFEKWTSHWTRYLSEVEKLRRISAKNVPQFRSFEQVEAFFRPDLPRFIAGLGGLTIEEAGVVAATIERYPTVRASVYYWWNAQFICLVNRRVPSVDKVDDYRHVVEASYSDVFVSNDRQLLRSLPRLQPTLVPLALDALVGPR